MPAESRFEIFFAYNSRMKLCHHSFISIHAGFFIRFWQWLSTVRTFGVRTLLYFTQLIGVTAPFTDCCAAASVQRKFSRIKWQRQTADRTLAKVALIGLSEQFIITYFSHPPFACLLVLRPMIFLAVDAAILH
jgi:hypothetical protein